MITVAALFVISVEICAVILWHVKLSEAQSIQWILFFRRDEERLSGQCDSKNESIEE